MTTGGLARQFGVARATAQRWLAEARLGAPDPYLDPAVLRELYVERRLTAREVAAELGVSGPRVDRALVAANIAVRPPHLPPTPRT